MSTTSIHVAYNHRTRDTFFTLGTFSIHPTFAEALQRAKTPRITASRALKSSAATLSFDGSFSDLDIFQALVDHHSDESGLLLDEKAA